jgi:hypothetical protein
MRALDYAHAPHRACVLDLPKPGKTLCSRENHLAPTRAVNVFRNKQFSHGVSGYNVDPGKCRYSIKPGYTVLHTHVDDPSFPDNVHITISLLAGGPTNSDFISTLPLGGST